MQHATRVDTPQRVGHWRSESYLLKNTKNTVGKMFYHDIDGNNIEKYRKVS